MSRVSVRLAVSTPTAITSTVFVLAHSGAAGARDDALVTPGGALTNATLKGGRPSGAYASYRSVSATQKGAFAERNTAATRVMVRARRNLQWLREEAEHTDAEFGAVQTFIEFLERRLPESHPRSPDPLSTSTADGSLAIEWGIKGSRAVAVLESDLTWRVLAIVVGETWVALRDLSTDKAVLRFVEFAKTASAVAS